MTSGRGTRRSARIVHKDTSIYKDDSDSEDSDTGVNESDDEYMAATDANKKRSKGPTNSRKKVRHPERLVLNQSRSWGQTLRRMYYTRHCRNQICLHKSSL